ncbi:hypothetical protein ACFL4C_01845 [Candidatus Omnitrophota bacterium]
MSDKFKHKDFLSPASDKQDVMVLIKKMQQQLVFLEKKIDILINQSSHRPFSEKHFSKPSRPFGRPYRSFDRKQGEGSGEKRFDRGRNFGKRHSGESRRFDHKKKVYDDSREGDFGQSRRFAKPNYGQKDVFDHKKKVYSDSREGDFGQSRRFAKRNYGQNDGFDQKKKPFPHKGKGRR